MMEHWDEDFVAWVQIVDFCITIKNEMLNEQSLSNDELAHKMDEVTQQMIQDNHDLCEKIMQQNEEIIRQNDEILALLKGKKS